MSAWLSTHHLSNYELAARIKINTNEKYHNIK
uniref:Uncharacterized protein n=1 Tax=Arundo donax TaxID=35708 RepID=A0A0A9AJR3_ARUDO